MSQQCRQRRLGVVVPRSHGTVPETLVCGAPEAFVDHMLDTWAQRPDVFPPALRGIYCDPARVHPICEQYRAASTLDVEHNEADRGRHRPQCPVLALWSVGGPVAAR
jgi:haloacetate dehalogenase